MSSHKARVALLDYGMGNLHSVRKQLRVLGLEPFVASDPSDLSRADKIILPGVGHFAKAMSNLAALGLVEALNSAVKEQGKPLLGICLGMQLLGRHSEEGSVAGLDWIDAKVIRFQVSDPRIYKVPHTGWNTMSLVRSSALLKGIPDQGEFYFVHAYHMQVEDDSLVIGRTDYENSFVSAVESGNIYGVQFHPEKSYDLGRQLFRNFLDL